MTNSQMVLLEIRQLSSISATSSLYHYTFAAYRICWANHETPALYVHDMTIIIQNLDKFKYAHTCPVNGVCIYRIVT